jgi:hypothetical protein
MQSGAHYSRRRFLKQSFAFSAAMAAPAALTGCGSGIFKNQFLGPHLLMVGDWGEARDYTDQSTVAAAMQNYVATQNLAIDALLMLGDNFYGSLDGGVTSSRWDAQFEQMYPVTLCHGPAYAIPGNHDYEISPMAKFPEELAYAKKSGTRWTMPSPYYRFEFPEILPLLTVIALDSNVAIPDSPAPNGFYTMSEDQWQQQLVWLEAELQKPLKTPYLAVMAHHPVYSDGPHGDHPVLVEDWDPLLRKYNVDLYIAGHDHDMQHLEFEGHPTSFFMSGGGGADLYPITTSPAQRGPMAVSVHGFSHLEVKKEWMTLRHLDQSGNLIHVFRKYPDGSVEIGPLS